MNKRIKKKKGLSKIRKEELYDLNITLSKYILPRLKAYRKMDKIGYPFRFNSVDEWNKVLDKMILSFEFILKGANYSMSTDEFIEYSEKYEEGMKLFSEYFSCLWD